MSATFTHSVAFHMLAAVQALAIQRGSKTINKELQCSVNKQGSGEPIQGAEERLLQIGLLHGDIVASRSIEKREFQARRVPHAVAWKIKSKAHFKS